MPNGNVRRPDVTVDCRPPERGATESQEPTVFFEVLSPSTRGIDFLRKAEEYRRLPTLRGFVLLEPTPAKAWVWTRDEDGGWSDRVLADLNEVIELPSIGVSLPLSELYEGVPGDLAPG